MDGQAILSIRYQVLIEHQAIISPAIVEDKSFYRFIVERKMDCSSAPGFILYVRSKLTQRA
jgi:hypothetical protein